MVFIPRGDLLLQDGFSKAGAILIDNWTGDETASTIWNTDGIRDYIDEDIDLAARLVSHRALASWGERWTEAARRFWDALDPTQFELHTLLIQNELRFIRTFVSNEAEAMGLAGLHGAARAVVQRAYYRGYYLLGNEPTNLPVPSLETDAGPDPIELDEDDLRSIEVIRNDYFASRDTTRKLAQERWRELVEWFRQEIYARKFTLSYIGKMGGRVEINHDIFGLDDCEILFRSFKMGEHDVLMPESVIAELQKTPRAMGKIRDERDCLVWLESKMRESPSEKGMTKENAKEEWRKSRSIDERAFLRAWNSAVRNTGAAAWAKPGAPKTKSKR